MSPHTRTKWLAAAAILFLILPGILMVAGLNTPLGGLTAAFLDLGVMPLDAGQPVDSSSSRLLTAILGGVLAGLGLLIFQVAIHVLPRDPALARTLLLPAILGWYVIDSTGSVLVGGWMNAVLNTGYAAILLAPLLWTHPQTVNAA